MQYRVKIGLNFANISWNYKAVKQKALFNVITLGQRGNGINNNQIIAISQFTTNLSYYIDSYLELGQAKPT